MDQPHLYQQIVESIRKDILTGQLKPGMPLPPIRKMTQKWDCTAATIQHAYAELARQGLVAGHVGQGTKVVDCLPEQNPIRRAMLFNRTEAFLLEMMRDRFTPDEIEQSLRVAMDRWRTVSTEPAERSAAVLRFVGSHDPAMALIASHFQNAREGFSLQLSFSGSLGGLIALAQKNADLAGCHLWDETTDTYNEPYVRKLLPGQKVAFLVLAHRRLGLILPPGNPLNLSAISDLSNPGVRFVNRQQGSGTRVWLDAQLHRQGIDPKAISGYSNEKMTHSEVARSIQNDQANIGLGVETAALTFGLDFKLLTTERYDLVIPAENWELASIRSLRDWLSSPDAKTAIANLGGYETGQTASVRWIS